AGLPTDGAVCEAGDEYGRSYSPDSQAAYSAGQRGGRSQQGEAAHAGRALQLARRGHDSGDAGQPVCFFV
nr:hypothetical protein [Tanacetum cinerariifolium]